MECLCAMVSTKTSKRFYVQDSEAIERHIVAVTDGRLHHQTSAQSCQGQHTVDEAKKRRDTLLSVQVPSIATNLARVDGFSLSRSSWTYIHFVYVIYIFALYFTLKGILTFYDCGCRLQSVGGG
jgi:hypothetical protein